MNVFIRHSHIFTTCLMFSSILLLCGSEAPLFSPDVFIVWLKCTKFNFGWGPPTPNGQRNALPYAPSRLRGRGKTDDKEVMEEKRSERKAEKWEGRKGVEGSVRIKVRMASPL